MAGNDLSVQQFIKQELIEISDRDTSAAVKQENFIQEKVQYNSSLNGEYVLDLNSPEFDLQNIAIESPITYDQSDYILFSKPKIKVKRSLSTEQVEPEIKRSKENVRNLEQFELTGIKSNFLNKENLSYNLEIVKTETDVIKEEEIISAQPNIQINILNKHGNNNTIKINTKLKSKSNQNSKNVCETLNKSTKLSKVNLTISKSGASNYECPYCGYKCKYEAIFEDHMSSHQNVPMRKTSGFNCDFCYFECKDKKVFDKHIAVGHDQKLFKCLKCDYKNTCESQFKSHKTKTGHKSFKCSECELEFNDKDDLKKHLYDHEIKMYECAECKKVMKYKHFQRHLLNHAKPFECNMCDYKANNQKRLQDHILVHQNLKPYECEVCKKPFRVEQHLKRHMDSHKNRNDRRLYECSICKKTYTFKQTLKLHHSKKHGEIPFPLEMPSIP